MPSASFSLPPPAQRWIEALTTDFLQPSGAPPFDFANPKGAPALAAPDSVAWRLFKNPLAVLIGGIAAVLLELAEPRIRDGVWEHSSFRDDPLLRLQRTGLAAMVTVYGARAKAEAMIAGVVRLHARIAGTTSEGRPYRADDPDLLDWVQATASFGILQAYAAYVRPLSAAERNGAYAEALPAAALFGAHGAPRSEAELQAMFEARRASLAPSPIVFRFLQIMERVPALPPPLRPLQPSIVRAAADILPGWIRHRLQLGPRWALRAWERPLVRAAGLAGDRLILRSSPAVQSCRRLGLPDDYLYR
jgi:uncharacterized protein (DUF2236 family)